MPKISKRQKTIKEIDQILFLLIVFDAEENEEQIQELIEDTVKVNQWIVACLILHNMVLKFNDDWEEEIAEEEENIEETEDLVEENGEALRERIKRNVLE